jgi:HEAT repeat protein
LGLSLPTPASCLLFGQTPEGAPGRERAPGQDHSPRQDRLAALGLLDVPADEEKVIKALSDADWYVRGEAALVAAKLGNKVPAQQITPLLADSNWFVRSAALEALAASGDPSAGPALQHLLDPEEPYLCARAASLLGEIKYLAAEEPLIRMLSEGDDQIKRAAAAALATMKSQKAVDPLTGLLGHQSPGVRSAAASALGRMGDARAVAPIQAAMKQDADDDNLLEFAIALYRLGSHDHVDLIARGLKSQYPDQRVESLAALSESTDPRALDSLAEAASRGLAHPNAVSGSSDPLPPRLRIQLTQVLAKYSDPKARDALISMLADPDPEVRAASVAALADLNSRVESGSRTGISASGESGPPKGGTTNGDADPTVDAIIKLIKTEHSPVVVAAIAKSIDALGRERVVDALIPLAESSPAIKETLYDLGVTAKVMSDKLREGKGPERIRAAHILGRLRERDAVPALIDALNESKERDFKVAAAESLGLIGDRRAEDALIHATQMPEAPVRSAAIKALGKLGDATVTETLFEAARDRDSSVREAAASSLGLLGVSVERLTADARSPSWQIRAAAMTTLARLGDPRGLQVLVSGLSDKDDNVRAEAARSLAVMGDARALDPLIGALHDPSPDVRLEAAVAVGGFKNARAINSLTGLLGDRDWRVSAAAAEALAKMNDDRAIKLVVESLGSADWRLRARAAQVLARVPEATIRGGAVPLLASALRDRDLVVRYYASEALVAAGEPAVPVIIQVFLSNRFQERERAARVLARIGKPAAQPLGALLEDKATPPETKASAARILGFIADPRSVDPLLEVLSDQRYFVREQAAVALGRIGGPAIQRLLELARSSSPATREAAIAALGGVSGTLTAGNAASESSVAGGAQSATPEGASQKDEVIGRLIDTILNALRDSNTGVRSAAVRALGSSASRQAVEPLMALIRDESSTLRGEATTALGRLGTAAVPALIAALSSPRPSIRMLAAQALGEIRSREAVPALINIVKTDLSGARGEAVEALGKIGDPSASDAIISALKTGSNSVRHRAIMALALLPGPGVEDAMIGALADKDEEVRQTAVSALGEVGDARSLPKLEQIADNDTSSDIRAAAAAAVERVRTREGKK